MKKSFSIRILSIIISAIFALSPAFPCFAQSEKNNESSGAVNYPSIIITGYFLPGLYTDYGTENQKEVWAMKKTIPKLLGVAAATVPTIPALLFPGGENICGKAAADAFNRLFEFSKGSNDYDTRSQKPQEASLTYYNNNGLKFIDKDLSIELGKKQGSDNVFTFAYDWRDNVVDTVETLKIFIDGVTEYTGAEKINLFGLSFGGLVAGAYLVKYGNEGKIKNAVLDVPALGGTEAIGNFFGQPEIQGNTIANIIGDALGMRVNFKRLAFAKSSPMVENFNKAVKIFAENTADITLSWGSFWDLMKTDDYERMKAAYTDVPQDIIEKSDELHYSIMPGFRSAFAQCKGNGTNISIIANYTDYPTVFGGSERGDILIETYLESGAKVAPVNKTLGDNYSQVDKCCGKNHVSKDSVIDASCAYLPDSTWFIKDHYHGTYSKDKTNLSLIVDLLLADKTITVFSDSRYPQFIM